MASRGDIKIPIAVDAGGVAKAINNGLIEPVEDAEDALRRLGKTDVGRDIDKEMDRAQDATEDLSRELDDTRADLKKLGFAAKDAGDDGESGMHRIREGASEVRSEISQNLGETVSSFRGDLSDLGQVGQDTFGGLAATVGGLGPGGFLASLVLAAGALGLGAITQGIQDAKDKQEELNKLAGSLASIYEGQASGVADALEVLSNINSIANDPEQHAQAEKYAEQWGVTIPTAIRVMAGDTLAMGIAQQSLNDKTQEWYDSLSPAEQKLYDLGQGFQTTNSDITDGQAALDNYTAAHGIAQQGAKDDMQAAYDYATAVGTATGKTDDFGNTILKLPDGKEVVVNAETHQASEDLNAFANIQIPEKGARVRMMLDRAQADRDLDDFIYRAGNRSFTIRGNARVALIN